ncbi:hypothetical protein PMPD1_3134 [Paramixta manurensis]|uniref:Uncharacterized protein n=2 Tax=Paramixta manurensis TaxID=2740817 RepID=A0A6M8UEQ6_9GAMM|nr:hypothetical protein PMPD1_3134 [Erwiniaceae bacterium PD-1]
MCDCMKNTAEKVRGHLEKRVPINAEVSTGLGDTGWQDEWLSLEDGKLHVMLIYKLAYRARKKDGSMAKNLTRLSTGVSMAYCPFCGEKFGGDHA